MSNDKDPEAAETVQTTEPEAVASVAICSADDWQSILRERRCLACGSSDIEMYPHSGKANCLVPGCEWEVNRFGYVPFHPWRGSAIRIGQTALEKRLLQLLFGSDYRNETLDTVRALAAAELEPGQKKIAFDLNRKFPSRRTYRITGAPECDPPTDREILGLLCRARPGSDWSVQECIEDSPLLVISPQNATAHQPGKRESQ